MRPVDWITLDDGRTAKTPKSHPLCQRLRKKLLTCARRSAKHNLSTHATRRSAVKRLDVLAAGWDIELADWSFADASLHQKSLDQVVRSLASDSDLDGLAGAHASLAQRDVIGRNSLLWIDVMSGCHRATLLGRSSVGITLDDGHGHCESDKGNEVLHDWLRNKKNLRYFNGWWTSRSLIDSTRNSKNTAVFCAIAFPENRF